MMTKDGIDRGSINKGTKVILYELVANSGDGILRREQYFCRSSEALKRPRANSVIGHPSI